MKVLEILLRVRKQVAEVESKRIVKPSGAFWREPSVIGCYILIVYHPLPTKCRCYLTMLHNHRRAGCSFSLSLSLSSLLGLYIVDHCAIIEDFETADTVH